MASVTASAPAELASLKADACACATLRSDQAWQTQKRRSLQVRMQLRGRNATQGKIPSAKAICKSNLQKQCAVKTKASAAVCVVFSQMQAQNTITETLQAASNQLERPPASCEPAASRSPCKTGKDCGTAIGSPNGRGAGIGRAIDPTANYPEGASRAAALLGLRAGRRHRRRQTPSELSCDDFHTEGEQSFCIFAARRAGCLSAPGCRKALGCQQHACHRGWRQAGATWLPSLSTWQLRR